MSGREQVQLQRKAQDDFAPGKSAESAERLQFKRQLASMSYSEQVEAVRPKRLMRMLSDQPVQTAGTSESSAASVKQAAAEGLSGSGSSMPYLDKIQSSFGSHDVSSVKAHVGGAAEKANKSMGSTAYASGNSVAFKSSPDLHTAAHEAAHVIQQRSGVSLSSGVGQAGDKYEKHADQVADRVVSGKSSADLLGGGAAQPVQMSSGQVQKHGNASNEAALALALRNAETSAMAFAKLAANDLAAIEPQNSILVNGLEQLFQGLETEKDANAAKKGAEQYKAEKALKAKAMAARQTLSGIAENIEKVVGVMKSLYDIGEAVATVSPVKGTLAGVEMIAKFFAAKEDTIKADITNLNTQVKLVTLGLSSASKGLQAGGEGLIKSALATQQKNWRGAAIRIGAAGTFLVNARNTVKTTGKGKVNFTPSSELKTLLEALSRATLKAKGDINVGKLYIKAFNKDGWGGVMADRNSTTRPAFDIVVRAYSGDALLAKKEVDEKWDALRKVVNPQLAAEVARAGRPLSRYQVAKIRGRLTRAAVAEYNAVKAAEAKWKAVNGEKAADLKYGPGSSRSGLRMAAGLIDEKPET